jgi:hypothetical protein
MKYVGRLMGKVVPCSVALLAASLVSLHAQTQQGSATVFGLKGSADYSDGGGTWMPLKVGKVLRAGAIIRTAPDSQVDLNLKRNGPVVRVTQNTTLGLDKLLFENTGADVVIETALDLKAGRILGRVNKTAAASKYEVKTPHSVTGIRGTEYDISADGLVIVKNGSAVVVFVDAQGKSNTFVVNERQTFDPTIPGVRGATGPEIDQVNPPPPGTPAPPFVVIYEPGREPYVSPISSEDVANPPSSTSF